MCSSSFSQGNSDVGEYNIYYSSSPNHALFNQVLCTGGPSSLWSTTGSSSSMVASIVVVCMLFCCCIPLIFCCQIQSVCNRNFGGMGGGWNRGGMGGGVVSISHHSEVVPIAHASPSPNYGPNGQRR